MSDQWTLKIRPRKPWFDLSLKEVLDYRFLLFLFVKRDFDIVFKQTILGPLWYIIQPLFTSGIFTLIFGAIAKLPTDGIPQPLFYFSGVALWGYFAAVVTSTAQTFQAQSYMFNKVYFPRLISPLSMAIGKLLTFGIQILFLVVIYIAYLSQGATIAPSWALVFLPVVIFMTMLLGMGIGLWIAAWSVRFRDLINLVSFGVTLLMYATPVIYPLSLVQSKWKFLMYFNPMTGMVELYRLGLFGQGTLDPILVTVTIVSTVSIFLVGLVLFSRAQQTAMDVV